MLKFVLVVVVVVALLAFLWRRPASRVPPPEAKSKRVPGPQGMVECAHCGVHLPQADAVQRDGRAYCGSPHADAGPRRDGH